MDKAKIYRECEKKQNWCTKDAPCILIVHGGCGDCSYFKNPDIEKKWMFSAEDENGDSRYLNEEMYVGTEKQAREVAEMLADKWEVKTGGLILKLTIESHGRRG